MYSQLRDMKPNTLIHILIYPLLLLFFPVIFFAEMGLNDTWRGVFEALKKTYLFK